MCTMTHFATDQSPYTHDALALSQALHEQPPFPPVSPARPRFQVVLAGNAFFHIKETSTGRVRGFRGDHNQACALARSLESRE
ncbi:hypothetical protein J2X66_003887 [Pseudomonas sp. 3296]|uniref:hypothetical protein n=1 Tax=Pseudomonas sp. 3296 TaxID=2817753 RepID=UPI0028653082|nr:hypothetical protein [Pseudomonas sp. 3296]MDR6917008.1 hypothetical protein [Pseudomonas sp. 3296]